MRRVRTRTRSAILNGAKMYPSLRIFTKTRADCVALIGHRGCGKTTCLMHFIGEAPHVLLYDPLHQYTGSGVHRADLSNIKDDAQAWGERVLDYCKRTSGRKLVIVEELGFIADACGGGKLTQSLTQMIIGGRNFGIMLIAVTQRPKAVFSKTMFSQLDWLLCFGAKDADDRSFLSKSTTLPDDLFHPKHIPRHHALLVDMETSAHQILDPVPR